MMSGAEPLVAFLAAGAAGFVNALAGGGTLITFPVLLALGLPPIAANVTNTVALCPGYFGATLAQRRDLAGQQRRLLWALPAAALGGVAGGVLLLWSGDRLFGALVPYLILLACALLAAQNPVRRWLGRREAAGGRARDLSWATPIAVGASAIYGGYFGAGLSVIVLAALALTTRDTLVRLNAVKQSVALTTNVAAALLFVGSGQVRWETAAVMAAGALGGGALGGRLAGRLSSDLLRTVVVTAGVAIALLYLFRR